MEGIHIDNDDIKNVAEDVQDMVHDVGRLLDLDRPNNKKWLELDAKLRFSNPTQELLKMVLNDFGITDEKSFRHAVKAIRMAVEDGIENCPYLERAQKAADRFFRFYAKAIKVDDLPKG